LWKIEPMNNEIGYLVEEIYKQSVEWAACFLLSAYNKMWTERHELKKELLSIKGL
jgi:hypothetical protein